MTGQGSFRLRDLLGAAPSDLTEDHFKLLIAQEIREDDDLDFKCQDYGGSDSEKRELAADLASFGNHRGGVIVIGIRDENDMAVELTPAEFPAGTEGRLRQIAASNIVPHLPVEIHEVPSSANPKVSYVVLVVPASPQKPHAVRHGNNLRYPIRDGTTKRWLSEAEVASMYRNRHSLVLDQIARVDQVTEEGSTNVQLDPGYAYLALSLVPTSEGSMSLGFARLKELEEWATHDGPTHWRGFFRNRPTARTGLRKVKLGNLLNHELPTGAYAELHTAGSGFCCDRVGRPGGNDGSGPLEIPGVLLLWGIAKSLSLLGHHAVRNTGAWGDAVVVARLIGGEMNLTYPSIGGFPDNWNRAPLAGPLDTENTLPLDSMVGPDQELLAATRVIAGDLFNAFEAPEVSGLEPDGRIRIGYFNDQERLIEMAERAGVEVSQNAV